MDSSQTTCWALIRQAASGEAADRDEFARRYGPLVRHYLAARWRGSALAAEVDDAVQEVFIECFRGGGALQSASESHGGGFRAFLYGVVRHIALRVEARRARSREQQPTTGFHLAAMQPGDDTRLSQVFDREFARATMQQAARRQAALAEGLGDDAKRRLELLRLRFQDNLPIREIAARWGIPAERVHREYAKARGEFRDALMETLILDHRIAPGLAEDECRRLLEILA